MDYLVQTPDYLLTLAHFLRNVRRNLSKENTTPNREVSSLQEVTLNSLDEQGIEGIVYDVDNCLMTYHGQEVAGSVRLAYEQLDKLKVILSNSGEKRFRELGTIFKDVPVLRMYEDKETGDIIYRKLENGEDYWGTKVNDVIEFRRPEDFSLSHMSMDHDFSGYRVVKKPDPRLLDYAAGILKIQDKRKIAMIGDRLLTDIVGGNIAGCYTIHVNPMGSEPWLTKISRLAELAIRFFHAVSSRGK